MAMRDFGCLIGTILGVGLLVTACSPSSKGKQETAAATGTEVVLAKPFAWPAGLRLMDDGYPTSGDPCRRLGETDLTVNYLDHSARLVGCPGSATDPATTGVVGRFGGTVVGSAEGVTLVSIPQGDANVGMAEAVAGNAQ